MFGRVIHSNVINEVDQLRLSIWQIQFRSATPERERCRIPELNLPV